MLDHLLAGFRSQGSGMGRIHEQVEDGLRQRGDIEGPAPAVR